jgi:hypothetical protein
MTRLILTTDDSGAGSLRVAGKNPEPRFDSIEAGFWTARLILFRHSGQSAHAD